MKASENILRQTAKLAVHRVTGGKYNGMCDPISIDLCKLLHTQGIKTQGIASTDFLGKHPHYVALLSGEEVSFTQSHQVLVDPTILQFEDELTATGVDKEKIPETKIITEEDDEWIDWYQDLEPIDDRRL